MKLLHESPNGNKVYSLFGNDSDPETPFDRDNLEVGQKLKFIGYGDSNCLITERYESDYDGKIMYKYVDVDKETFGSVEAYAIRHIDDKFGIGLYYVEGESTTHELLEAIRKAKAKEDKVQAAGDAAKLERERLIEIGRPLAEKYLKGATAIIMAFKQQDESDSMTDYFGSSQTDMVILGVSNKKRDDFNEMRKVAARFEPTAHLAEKNDEYEHREKWSMGHGFYLKKSHYDSTGWGIYKRTCDEKYFNHTSDELAVSLAKHCVFTDDEQPAEKKPIAPKGAKPEPTGECTIEQYKGFPVITIPLSNGRTFSLGKAKAQAVLNHIADVQGFVDS